MSKKTTIIPIGNSKGIRIPKSLLVKSELPEEVELEVERGEIRIVPARDNSSEEIATLSSEALATDWLKPEEDEAWVHL